MIEAAPFKSKITSEENLRSIVGGYPSDLANNKVINHLDPHCIDFISKSPFLVLSTSNQNGISDLSPRGDMPGFVNSLNSKYIVIPERPGNKRVDSMRNILCNPNVGLLFFIPGLGETLRVKGKATIINDEDILEKMAVKGRKPLIAIAVEIEECFIHCAKAFKRSGLWEPKTWPEEDELPLASKILFEHAKLPNTSEQSIYEGLQESYSKRLY